VIIAVISDVHANLEALSTVLEDVARQGAERLWCLGDVVGYGADPNPVCDRIAAQADVAIAGNHDWAAVGKLKVGFFNSAAALAIDWTADQLSETSREWLASLPLVRIEGEARLVHATPSDPAAWQYVLSKPDAEAELDAYQEPLCLIGHSHFPATYENDGAGTRYLPDERVTLVTGRRYLVNVGSVGQPRDGDPRASYLLYDTEGREIVRRRLEYDIDTAARKILEAGLPEFLAQRLQRGR
jgi:diadenosine tetraphosphatase ApaH/serine/threonine PP2A family protein phosphatase